MQIHLGKLFTKSTQTTLSTYSLTLGPFRASPLFLMCYLSRPPPTFWKRRGHHNLQSSRRHTSAWGKHPDCLRAGTDFPKTQQKISAEWLHVEANAQTPVSPPSPPSFPLPASLSPCLDVSPQKVALEHLILDASKAENKYPLHSLVIPQWQPLSNTMSCQWAFLRNVSIAACTAWPVLFALTGRWQTDLSRTRVAAQKFYFTLARARCHRVQRCKGDHPCKNRCHDGAFFFVAGCIVLCKPGH